MSHSRQKHASLLSNSVAKDNPSYRCVWSTREGNVYIWECPSVHRRVPTLDGVPTLDWGYLPCRGTYLTWGVPTLNGGYLNWMGGTYLARVPTLSGGGGYLLWMGGVLTLDGRYLYWIWGTYLTYKLGHEQYASCSFPQEDFLGDPLDEIVLFSVHIFYVLMLHCNLATHDVIRELGNHCRVTLFLFFLKLFEGHVLFMEPLTFLVFHF